MNCREQHDVDFVAALCYDDYMRMLLVGMMARMAGTNFFRFAVSLRIPSNTTESANTSSSTATFPSFLRMIIVSLHKRCHLLFCQHANRWDHS